MTEPRDPSASTPDLPPNADPSATARMSVAEPAPATDSSGSGWTTPPPTAARKPARTDEGRGPSLVFGLILLAVGLWFFAEQTLGLDLPTLRWSQLWPLILIVIGVWILFGARRRAG